ncbi:MAG: hypothetical protein WAT39_20505 [Planctomycetota bacterium]
MTGRLAAVPACWAAGLLAACSGAPSPADREALIAGAVVQRDVEHLVKSIYAGEFDVVVAKTHPVILEWIGGAAKARELMAAAVEPMLAKGIHVESLRFPQPPEFVRTERAAYSIVPTLMILTIGSDRVESLNYQFGVLEPGASGWLFIEGSRVNGGNVRSLFADFPAGHTFPQFHRRRL